MDYTLQSNRAIIQHLYEKFDALRIAKQLTLEQISEQSDISRTTINNFKKGEDIRLSTLLELMRSVGRLDELENILVYNEAYRPSQHANPPRKKRVYPKQKEQNDAPFSWGDES